MKEFVRSLLVFMVMSLLTGLAYPFVVAGLSRIEFGREARGSLVVLNGKTVGSTLIGQQFVTPRNFHGRPSAIERPYDASNSGASNWGPSNAKFLEEVSKRVKEVRKEYALPDSVPVPSDLVLASGSGLDPHITPRGAAVQVERVAKTRGLPESEVLDLIGKYLETPFLGFIGEERVNVLALNMALDDLSSKKGKAGSRQ